MIVGAELTIYDELGNNINFDLSSVQLFAVCEILGLEYADGNLYCFSDEGIKKILDLTINRFEKIK